MACEQCKTNRERAVRISNLLVPGYGEVEIEQDAVVIDALTDLRHLCDAGGWDFANLDRIAHQHCLEELSEEAGDGTTN